MLLLRKIVFYTFALVYLILCPLIVARMLGFVVSPLTHHLVKTGLIYVSTLPSDATVYIDGRLSRQKTPTALRDLAPGDHFIRIELDGYNDWEKNIPVMANKATVLTNRVLIPQTWPMKVISSEQYQNIFKAGPGILIAANKLKDNSKFLKIDLNQNPPLIQDVSDSPNLSTALTQKINQDQILINDNNDLLTRQGAWIQLSPKEDFGSPETYTIAKTKPRTNWYFDRKNGGLFYLDEHGALCMVQVLPPHNTL